MSCCGWNVPLKTLAAALILLLLRTSPSCQDAKDPALKEIEKAFDFGAWPGKKGTLKPGLKFDPADYPSLAGFSIVADIVSFEQIGSSMTSHRSVELSKDAQRLFVTLQVSQDKTDVAQEALLRRLGGATTGATAWQRGDLFGLQAGDLNFISSAVTSTADGTVITPIHFVRNNVGVILGKSSAPALDLKALAQAVDAKIKAEPNYAEKEDKKHGIPGIQLVLPQITRFEPAAKTIAPSSSTELLVTANDPQGLKLQLEFTSTAGRVERNGASTTFVADASTGKVTITLSALNEALLFSAAETHVQVR